MNDEIDIAEIITNLNSIIKSLEDKFNDNINENIKLLNSLKELEDNYKNALDKIKNLENKKDIENKDIKIPCYGFFKCWSINKF